MKKTYKKPVVKFVDFQYDEQIAATSTPVYCDQGWTLMTTLDPRGTCKRCDSDLIWLNEVQPWSLR